MKRSKLPYLIMSLVLCSGVLMAGLSAQPVSAQAGGEEAEESAESFELQPKFPVLSGPADTTFEFTVGMRYRGDTARVFDLNVSGPEGWVTFIAESSYRKEKRLAAIRLETYSLSQELVVIAEAPYWLSPEPGEYTIKIEAVSEDGKLRDTADLTAKIDARYAVSASTSTGRLNTKATAGKESTVTVVVRNTGTATLDNVTFSSSKPRGIGDEEWRVKFNPTKVETLAAGDRREVDVTIEPPSKAIAGDYMVTLNFDGDPDLSSDPPELEIRVAVSTPTMWGWVGAAIIVVVVAGVVVVFRYYGRR